MSHRVKWFQHMRLVHYGMTMNAHLHDTIDGVLLHQRISVSANNAVRFAEAIAEYQRS